MWEFFENLQPCNTWACVNSFASWASALITILFSGSALFISYRAYRYSRRKDVEDLVLEVGLCMVNTQPLQDAFLIKVTNIGHRVATVKSYEWIAGNKIFDGFLLPSWVLRNEVKALSAALPTVLEDGEEAQYFDEIQLFVKYHHLRHCSPFEAFMLIQSMRIGISTTRGRHFKRLPRKIRQLIWGQYIFERRQLNSK